jgi:hypothetical protein
LFYFSFSFSFRRIAPSFPFSFSPFLNARRARFAFFSALRCALRALSARPPLADRFRLQTALAVLIAAPCAFFLPRFLKPPAAGR